MRISDLFRQDVNRRIEEVVKVDLDDDASIEVPSGYDHLSHTRRKSKWGRVNAPLAARCLANQQQECRFARWWG